MRCSRPHGSLAIVGVRCDARHRQRVQRLEQQRPHATDEHRRVGVHPSDRRVVVEPARLRRCRTTRRAACRRQDRRLIADLLAQPTLHFRRRSYVHARRTHWLIVPRPLSTIRTCPKIPHDGSPTRIRSVGRRSATGSTIRSTRSTDRMLPRWVIPAIVLFWSGFLLTISRPTRVPPFVGAAHPACSCRSSCRLAIEPGVNKLAARGWRRGRATIVDPARRALLRS